MGLNQANRIKVNKMSDDKEQVSCRDCTFLEVGEINPNDVTDRKYFCKRLPPVPIVMPGPTTGAGQMSVQISTVFPMTSPDSWCGEWDDGLDDEIGLTELSEHDLQKLNDLGKTRQE
mgnify:CR=1 FL=1